MNDVIPAEAKHQPESVEASDFNTEDQIVNALSHWGSKGLYIFAWLLIAGFSILFWAGLSMMIF